MYGHTDLEAARERLIKRLGGMVNDDPNRNAPWSIMQLADTVMRIAEQEGRESVKENVTFLMTKSDWGDGDVEDTKENRWTYIKQQYIPELIGHGANDDASGRTNDMKRAFHDGVLSECYQILAWNQMEDYL